MHSDITYNHSDYDQMSRDDVEDITLMGRYLPEGDTEYAHIALWNKDEQLVKTNLLACLEELQKVVGPIPDICTLWVPFDRNTTLKDFLKNHDIKDAPLNYDERNRLELAKQMHLARSDKKKAIMKQLGVGGGGKKSGWTMALQNKGLLAPGHSIYNMHSESFGRKLDIILQNIIRE